MPDLPDRRNPPNLNSIVAKDNSLITKLAQMDLSELRLLSFCLAHLDSRQWDDRKIVAKVRDLLAVFPSMHPNYAYDVVQRAIEGVNRKPIKDEITDPETRHVIKKTFFWFSSFEYRQGAGEFSFTLTPEIMDRLVYLRGNFTKYRLRDVYQFRSAHTWKLYEVLKQWVGLEKWRGSLDELRAFIGMEGKYPRWADFEKRALKKQVQEINALSDIWVEYEKYKDSRAVAGVIFFIKAKEEARPKADFTIGDTNSDLRQLLAIGINQANAEKLSRMAKDAGKDLSHLLDAVSARYDNLPEEKKAVPKGGYVYKALENELTPTLFDYADDQARPKRKVSARAKSTDPEALSGEDETWRQIKHDLANNLSKNLFDTWISPLGFRRKGATAILIPPNSFFGKQVVHKLSIDPDKPEDPPVLQALQAAVIAAGFSELQVEKD